MKRKVLKVLLAFTMFVSVVFTNVLHISAKEDFGLTTLDSSLIEQYNSEISMSVISGDGTEANPYVLNYDLAPSFTDYLMEAYEVYAHSGTAQINSGSYVDNCLTVYQNMYPNGAVWSYTGGGMSVSSNGNLRIVTAVYEPSSQISRLLALRNSPTAFSLVCDVLPDYASENNTTIANGISLMLTRNGLTTIGGYTSYQIASALAGFIGAVGNAVSVLSLISAVVHEIENMPFNAAISANKNLVNISYMVAYQGYWYSYTTCEAGWTNNKVYTPAAYLGNGNFTHA